MHTSGAPTAAQLMVWRHSTVGTERPCRHWPTAAFRGPPRPPPRPSSGQSLLLLNMPGVQASQGGWLQPGSGVVYLAWITALSGKERDQQNQDSCDWQMVKTYFKFNYCRYF